MSGRRKDDPITTARRLSRAELPVRFYQDVTTAAADGEVLVLLDGRVAKTPARRPLALPNEALAALVAVEWSSQQDRIDPSTMPLTRIANVAIDRVADDMAAVRADIVAYAGSDLVCYRAEEPEDLIAREAAAWSPLVSWADAVLGAGLTPVTGIVHQPQHPGALDAVGRALESFDAFALAAVHTMTSLTGSAIIALAVAHRRITAEAAWESAHVDEDWQMSRWGRDAMALRRRAARWREMEAAALILRTVMGGGEGEAR